MERADRHLRAEPDGGSRPSNRASRRRSDSRLSVLGAVRGRQAQRAVTRPCGSRRRAT